MSVQRSFCSVLLILALLLCAFSATADTPIPVATKEDIKAVVDELNSHGGEKSIILTQDIELDGLREHNSCLILSNGTLTIFGGGHT